MKNFIRIIFSFAFVLCLSKGYSQWTQMTLTNFPKQSFTCNNAQINSIARTNTNLYVGTEYNGIHVLNLANPTSWTHIPFTGASSFLNSCGSGFTEYSVGGTSAVTYDIAARTDATGDVVVAAASGKVYRSDYGGNFYSWSTGLPTTGNYMTAILFVNDVVYSGGSNGTVYYRRLSDASWSTANTALGTINSLDYKTVIKSIGGSTTYHLQIGSSGGVYTRKLGTDSKPVTGFWNRNFVNASGDALVCEELIINHSVGILTNYALLAVGRKGTGGIAVSKLYRSIGGTAATTWEEVNAIDNDANAQLAWCLSKLIVSFNSILIDKSTDNGGTWSAGTTTGLTTDNVRDLAFDGSTYLYAGTYDDGVFRINYSTLKTQQYTSNSLVIDDLLIFPTLLSNGKNTISIRTTDEVYDAGLYTMEGNLVQKFALLTPNDQDIDVNVSVSNLTPGIYFLKVKTSREIATRKIIVQ